jgi:CO/xanthine dehydrogenase FAD-binding subunit
LYPAPFDYKTATSFEEAVNLLEEYGDEAKVLAGGQSLIPMMNLRYLSPSVLVDVNALESGGPHRHDGTVVIPALTRQRTVESNADVRRSCPILVEALRHVGNVRVRNRGTIGGNLAHGDPSSELSCAALAMGGHAIVTGRDTTRSLPLQDLFVGYLTTSLEPSELITELRVPVIEEGTGWSFLEMARRAGEFAIVNAACLLTLEPSGGGCRRVSLVLGGVGDTPVDISREASEVLVGKEAGPRDLDDVGSLASGVCEPRSDVHASAEYRRKIVPVLTKRALELARRRAQGEERS